MSNLKDGLSNGAIWALIALGYTLVYGIIQLINFAHGDLFMIGSFTAVGLYATFGLAVGNPAIGLAAGLLAVLVITMIVCGVLNAMIERVGYRPLRNAPKLAPADHGGRVLVHPPERRHPVAGRLAQQAAPDLIQSQKELFEIAGVSITQGDVLAVAATVPLLLLLAAFVTRSRMGKAMRATSQDPEAARLMGINVDTTISFTFLLGGLMAGAAGLIYALYQTTIWFFQGFQAGLIAFTAAVMGGIGSLQGAVLGGVIIGCIQQISDNRIGGEWTPAVVFAYLVLIMVVQAAGPARRADQGGRMNTAWLISRHRDLVIAVVLLGGRRHAAVLLQRGRAVHGRLGDGARVRRDGARAEHRGRLRGPARPRLRGVLRDRRLHDAAGSPPASPTRSTTGRASTSASATSSRTCPAST